MAGVVVYQRGFLPMAELLRHWAAIGEAAAFGQVNWALRSRAKLPCLWFFDWI